MLDYDVLFADEIKKCIPNGLTEKTLRHEKDAIQPTDNVEPTCNISSDKSEDENGSRDGDDSWLVTYEDDLMTKQPNGKLGHNRLEWPARRQLGASIIKWTKQVLWYTKAVVFFVKCL